MANPEIIACPEDVWTLVATAVTSGTIYKKITAPQYLQTYRETGEAAPTDETDAVRLDSPGGINSSTAIDVYIYAQGAAGAVRVDL